MRQAAREKQNLRNLFNPMLKKKQQKTQKAQKIRSVKSVQSDVKEEKQQKRRGCFVVSLFYCIFANDFIQVIRNRVLKCCCRSWSVRMKGGVVIDY